MNTAKIKAALELNECAVKWQAEFSPMNAMQFVARMGQYNEFSPGRVVGLIAVINDMIPAMQFQAGSPNNGKMHHMFVIGREHSPVVYLNIIKSYLPDGFDYGELATALKEAGDDALADEAWVTENGAAWFQFRYWWD